MKFTIKHEGREINATLPDDWNDLTVKQFLDLNKKLSHLEVLASLSNLNLSFIENTNTDLTPAIDYLNRLFSKVPPDLASLPKKPIIFEGKKIKVPKNLNFTKFGQKSLIKNLIESEDKVESMVSEVFAIYLQPVLDGKFDSKRIPDIERQVLKLKITDVFPWVKFFFLRLKILKFSLPNKSKEYLQPLPKA